VAVAVGEERMVAVPQLLHDKPDTQLIILDDAFQHRAIKAGLNILLTECTNLFTQDFFFPTGDLRDQKISAKRADIIIITKCPSNLPESEKEKIIKQLAAYKVQHIFFTTTAYQMPYHIITKDKKPFLPGAEILLVYGIANPQPLKDYIADNTEAYEEMSYSDHYIFSIEDLKDINKRFDRIQANDKLIITTEKDAVRFLKFKDQLPDMPLYVLPVQPRFLFNGEQAFNALINGFIETFKEELVE